MEPIVFDSINYGKNRSLIQNLMDEENLPYDTVQLVSIQSGETLFSDSTEGDMPTFLFYCYLSDQFAEGSDSFVFTDEMKKAAKEYFTAKEWDNLKSRQIQALRNTKELEVILL